MEERLASGKLVLDRPAEAVARLTISNPERRNALDHEILDAIAEALPRLDRGIETRCVLITGAPPVFSAGYDIAAIPEETFERDAEALVAHPFHDAIEAIAKHPWPTVAAINGHCLGGGLELAITCDLRICAAGAKLGMPPAKLGLIYGHTGLRQFLDTIGLARTKELFLTGRNYEATRAERLGLVNEVVDDDRLEAESVELAAEIAANAPLSMRGNKQAIDLLNACPDAQRPAGGGPDRPARVLLRLRGPARGDPRLRREAPARVDRAVSAKARTALAKSDPTMAALIERIGKIDLATRLRRRSEERPPDAYGALLRAIVGQQLSTKAARTIYLRVLDIFDGTTPSPEQLLEASEADLRGAGLSGRKVEYIRDLAAPRAQRRTGAGPARRARRRGGDRGDRRRARARPVDRRDVPALPPRAARRPLRRRPRHPQSGADRVRAGGDADARSRCWRSASPGGPTAASPRSTSGSRWPPSPAPESPAPESTQRTTPPGLTLRPDWPTMQTCDFVSGSASPPSC